MVVRRQDGVDTLGRFTMQYGYDNDDLFDVTQISLYNYR